MAEIIKTDFAEAEFTIRTRLDGRYYILRFAWNIREEAWSLGLYDSEAVPLALGLFLRANTNLLRQHTGEAFPPGGLIPVDTSGGQQDPGRDDLGRRVQLVYVTEAERVA